MKIDKKYEKLFKKSKPLFIVTTILTVIMLFIFSLWIACKCIVKTNQTFNNTTDSLNITTGKVVYTKGSETTLPELQKIDDNGNAIDDFKIAVVGDLHLNDNTSDVPLKALENLIKIDKPDLVVINGDICTWDAKTTNFHERLNQMFERNNQYWTFTLGNHDGQAWEDELGYDYARVKQFKALAGIEPTYPLGSSHCIADTRTGLDDSAIKTTGVGNNCIKIKGKDNKALKYLFTFDCEKLLKKNDLLVNWYKDTVNNMANDANNYVITHIPFMQMDYAWQHQNDDPEVEYISGVVRERIAYDTNEDSGLFGAIKDLNKTDCCIFSHDHINNCAIKYKGVRMQYSLGMSWNCYSSRLSVESWIDSLAYMLDCNTCNFYDGSTDLYIKNEDGVDKSVIGNVYAQFNGTLNGLEIDMWKALYGFVTVNAEWLTIQNRIVYPLISAGCIAYYYFFIQYHRQHKKDKKVKK